MLNYIASTRTSTLIQKICDKQNILVLYQNEGITNINKYLKEAKVNFNLIKYFIIEINCLEDKEDEIIESIYNFSRVFNRIRFIILAQGMEEQCYLLNQLYEKGIYNIINLNTEQEIEEQLIKCLSNEGMQDKDAKKFEKKKEIIVKERATDKIKKKIRLHKKENMTKGIKKEKIKSDMPSNKVYFFSLLLEAITRLVKFVSYVAVFVLTSIGLTILLNSELRELVFQLFGLK